jgi:transcriptional regulator with XRE-family HTH domain
MSNRKNKKYGEIIKKIRLERNYTQEYMGNNLGIAPNTYGNYENGNSEIGVEMLENIAKLFGVSVLELIPEDTRFKFKQTNNDTSTGVAFNQNESVWQEVIKAKDETIQVLQSTIDILKNKIS